MGYGRKGIIHDGTLLRSSPFGTGTLRDVNLGIGRRIGQCPATSKIHGFAICRKRTDALFKFTVHFGSKWFRLLPLFLFVPFGVEYIGALHSGDTIQISPLRFIAGRSEIQNIGIVTCIHWRIIATTGYEDRNTLHNMTGRILFPLLRQLAGGQSYMCQRVFTFFFIRELPSINEVILIIRYSGSIFTILPKHLCQIEMRDCIGIAVTNRIHIGSFGFQCVVDAPVTITLFISKDSTLRTVFG